MTIEEKIGTLRRSERRRFRQVCRARAYTTPQLIATKKASWLDYTDYAPNLLTTDLQWLFDQVAELGIDVEGLELRTYWKTQRQDVAQKVQDYRATPVRPKQDNKAVYASGYGRGGNTIRYPRKVRSKGCWDRFYALFPRAKPRVAEPAYPDAIPRRFPTSGQPPTFKAKKK